MFSVHFYFSMRDYSKKNLPKTVALSKQKYNFATSFGNFVYILDDGYLKICRCWQKTMANFMLTGPKNILRSVLSRSRFSSISNQNILIFPPQKILRNFTFFHLKDVKLIWTSEIWKHKTRREKTAIKPKWILPGSLRISSWAKKMDIFLWKTFLSLLRSPASSSRNKTKETR